MTKIVDLDYIADNDDSSVGEYIQARVEHIINALEVLNDKYIIDSLEPSNKTIFIKDTEEYDNIKYHAMQILKQLGLEW